MGTPTLGRRATLVRWVSWRIAVRTGHEHRIDPLDVQSGFHLLQAGFAAAGIDAVLEQPAAGPHRQSTSSKRDCAAGGGEYAAGSASDGIGMLQPAKRGKVLSDGIRILTEGLARRGKHRTPPGTVQVEALRLADQQLDRHVDEDIVQEADDQTGLAGHGGVHGVAGEEIAENGVLGVGRDASNQVARVEIAQRDRDPL